MDSHRLRLCSSYSARLMVLSVVVTETTFVYPCVTMDAGDLS